MMKLVRVLLVSLLFCEACCAQQNAVQPEKPSGGDAVQGKTTFMEMGCYACHGTTGAGGGTVGPRLAPTPVEFSRVLRELRTPVLKMPRYSGRLLTDQQVSDIYAYLKSIPAGKSASEIPILTRMP